MHTHTQLKCSVKKLLKYLSHKPLQPDTSPRLVVSLIIALISLDSLDSGLSNWLWTFWLQWLYLGVQKRSENMHNYWTQIGWIYMLFYLGVEQISCFYLVWRSRVRCHIKIGHHEIWPPESNFHGKLENLDLTLGPIFAMKFRPMGAIFMKTANKELFINL